MKNKGHIYFIMGTSGSGKWTLRKNLEKLETKNLEFLKSYVSRPMREWEIEWDIYYFISWEKFQHMINNDEFLEYEWVHNAAYYGTRLSDVIENGVDAWKKVCKEVDIEVLKNILKNNPQLKENMTSIFLSLTPEKLSERIKTRWAKMSHDDFENRTNSLKKEVEQANKYCDYIIDTSEKTPEEVLEEVQKILD